MGVQNAESQELGRDSEKGAYAHKTTVFCTNPALHSLFGIRAMPFTALNKDTSELYFELVPFDSEVAQRYSDRAVQIIKSSENGETVPCISTDPSFFKCKMCAFRNECRTSN